MQASFDKRVKRRVTARTHTFFAATAPGIEHLCLSELLSLPFSSDPQAQQVQGGVLFRGKLHDCYSANLHLRTANRILMRLSEFRSTAFSALEKRLADIDWELYLPPKGALRISVASAKSRLYHKSAVAQRVNDSVIHRMGSEFEASGDTGGHLFVRAESDQFVISLDSSGDLLYKRGIKRRSGKAPLRETTASAVLKIAGYRPGGLLADPMCGSGTFSLEAAMMARNLPAGWYRSFAFMEWPAFSTGRWKHLRREAEKRFAGDTAGTIFASDIRKHTLAHLKRNLNDFGLSNAVNVAQKDFFDLTQADFSKVSGREGQAAFKPGLVVLNPPYGRRIGSLSESRHLFMEIFNKLKGDFKGWDFAIIVPRNMIPKTRAMPVERYPLFHGGLNLVLLTGRVPL